MRRPRRAASGEVLLVYSTYETIVQILPNIHAIKQSIALICSIALKKAKPNPIDSGTKMNLLLVAESERKDFYASANCQKSWIAQPFVQAGFKAVEKWEFSPALLRKTNLMRAVLSLRGHPISIYFRPAAIALEAIP